jgi:D-methionine transport system substrate-binding protein
MNNIVKKTLIAAGLLTLFSASVAANETLTVGATPVPHAEILEFVKPELAKQGVDLKIKVFNDFIQPNQQLAEKNLDANYYQYRPFLENYNQTRHTPLVPVVGVHIEPSGAYSSKYHDIKARQHGAFQLANFKMVRAVNQVDLAFIFANYALEAGIDTDKALLVEKGSDLYVEYLVARPDNLNDPGIQKLAKALHSDAVRNFILTRYKGKIVPGF